MLSKSIIRYDIFKKVMSKRDIHSEWKTDKKVTVSVNVFTLKKKQWVKD